MYGHGRAVDEGRRVMGARVQWEEDHRLRLFWGLDMGCE